MCSVIGYWPPTAPLTPSHRAEIAAAFYRLFMESRLRGRHAYGIANPRCLEKSADPQDVVELFDPTQPTIAHCRYSTSGDFKNRANNQPLTLYTNHEKHVGGLMQLAFNGVIDMGTREEMSERHGVELAAENDGEILLRKMQHEYRLGLDDLLGEMSHSRVAQWVRQWLLDRTGEHVTFAGVWLVGDHLFAARNHRRPLWTVEYLGATWYFSTRNIGARARVCDREDASPILGGGVPEELPPGAIIEHVGGTTFAQNQQNYEGSGGH